LQIGGWYSSVRCGEGYWWRNYTRKLSRTRVHHSLTWGMEKRKKKGPLQGEEYEATLQGFHWPPAKNCNEYTRIALFFHSHSFCVSIVCARVRKCASRLLQKCNSIAKNKTAWCITYTGCFNFQFNLFSIEFIFGLIRT